MLAVSPGLPLPEKIIMPSRVMAEFLYSQQRVGWASAISKLGESALLCKPFAAGPSGLHVRRKTGSIVCFKTGNGKT